MPVVSTAQFLSTHFDYIIVGGGTSGLVVATRLSEDPNVTVGVIEAGDYFTDVPEIDVPGLMSQLVMNPTYDWSFFSVPQKYTHERAIPQPRGKGLGGSSMLNFLNLVRPSKEEYDALETLGNPGWNWESMLKYMKKSEHFIPPNLSPEDAEKFATDPDLRFHGTDGPLVKSFPLHVAEAAPILLDTLENLGIPRNKEHSDGRPIGGILTLTSVDPNTATRSYAASAYYAPNATRENLLVLTGARATKILMENGESSKVAVGVTFVKDNTKLKVTGVRRDIILSAGSLQTPQLLELSGIGDKTVLQSAGIDCLIDLPGVGENLQDHVAIPMIVEIDSKYETVDVLANAEVLSKHRDLYLNQKGILSSAAAPVFGFLPSRSFANEETFRVMHSHTNLDSLRDFTSNPSLRKGLEKQYNIQGGWFDDQTQPAAQILHFGGHFSVPGLTPQIGSSYASIFTALSHPLSRGSVHISSADPLAVPVIDPRYYSNPADLEVVAKAVSFTLRVFQTSPLGDIVKGPVYPPTKGGDISYDALKSFILDATIPVFHPIGTASMRPKEDGGVIDSKLRVYGTANLRVVDLSILPLEISCNTQTAAYAIGEKAADIIKGL